MSRLHRAKVGGRPTVVFDADDTLVNLRVPLMNTLNAHAGLSMDWRDWSDYALHQRYGMSLCAFLDLIVRSRVLERVTLEPGARRIVRAARQAGFNIEIWTARAFHPNAREITARSLSELRITPSQIKLFGIGASKASVLARRRDVALYVDDSPTHIGEAMRNGDGDRALLISRPWNATMDAPRRSSLDHIAGDLTRLSHARARMQPDQPAG